jgi:TRAP-type C4-dicarboxylate transport system permease small subunit
MTAPTTNRTASEVLEAVLLHVTGALAVFGGLLMTAGAVLTVVSVTGRYLFAAPINGNVEMVELASAAAVSCFLPYCQMKRGHVIVDFFTSAASDRLKAMLDTIAALLFAFCAGLIAWRLSLGGADMYRYNDQTMVLGIPTWISYAVMVPSFGLLALACLATAWTTIRKLVHPVRAAGPLS